MDGLKVAKPVDVAAATPKLMGSDGVIGARVCSDGVQSHDSDPKIDDFRGTTTATSPSWLEKTEAESCRSNCLSSRSSVEDVSLALVDGITSCSTILMSEYEGKQIQPKERKPPRNVSGSSKKPRLIQSDNLVSQAGADVTQVKVESMGSLLLKHYRAISSEKPRLLQSDQAGADFIQAKAESMGSLLMEQYNSGKERALKALLTCDASRGENMIISQSKDLLIQDKSPAVKLKNNINGRRGDRRNSKVPMKAKLDPFSLKNGLSNFSHANGGSNVFGVYGLKANVHDISKFMDDISLDELLDGTYKCPDTCMDKGKKVSNLTENILDSVKKACSVIRLQGVQEAKQAEEIDIQVNKKMPLSSSPSNTSVSCGPDCDDSNLSADLIECGKDLESTVRTESLPDKKNTLLYQPRDILERLELPPSKDLDSLLQDALKPLVSSKLSDSRSGNQPSNRASFPPFPWSHNFNGHYKSNNEAIRMSNKSNCQGRWVRIRSNASFIGGDNEDFVDLDLLTCDTSLVPAGKLIYRLPEIENSSAFINQQCRQQNPSVAVCPTSTVSLPPSALHSPSVLAAAQTLRDMACDSSIHISNGLLKWSKQPSQKAMKACKARLSENSDEFLTPKSEPLCDHAVRSIECVPSSKKPKISMIDRREDASQIHTIIGLGSVSAPRSNRSSPSRLSRDFIAEARNTNGSYTKPPFRVPPRVLDRNSHNPQKLRKVSPLDWNRTRS